METPKLMQLTLSRIQRKVRRFHDIVAWSGRRRVCKLRMKNHGDKRNFGLLKKMLLPEGWGLDNSWRRGFKLPEHLAVYLKPPCIKFHPLKSHQI